MRIGSRIVHAHNIFQICSTLAPTRSHAVTVAVLGTWLCSESCSGGGRHDRVGARQRAVTWHVTGTGTGLPITFSNGAASP